MRAIRGVYEENGYVKIRIWLGPKLNPDGSFNKPYRRSFGPWNNENIQRAKNHVDEVRKNHRSGTPPLPEPKAWSVPEACDYYFKRDWVDNPERSRNSTRNTGYNIERIKHFWRSRALHTLLPLDLEAYVVARKDDGIEDSTINRELGAISAIFTMINFWVQRREIGPYLLPVNVQGFPYNPAEYVKRASTIESKRRRVATDEELCKVKVYCDKHDPDLLEIIVRSILTGLRKTDLEKVNGKADVRGILSKTRERKLFEFPVDFSRRLKYKNFPSRWDDLREACGMKDFHWHDWRHTTGTMLKRMDFTEEQIREFYGHATVTQTRDYLNLGKERLEPHVKGLRGHLSELWQGIPAPVPADPTKKECLGCHGIKDLGEFGKHSAAGDGLNSRCRKCAYAATKARRDADPSIRDGEYERIRHSKLPTESVFPIVSGRVSRRVLKSDLTNGL